MDRNAALATVTRHDDGTLTYRIDDPYDVGFVEVSIPILLELFRRAGIKNED